MSFSVGAWANEKKKTFKEDLIAGLIVAIVALPLAIGFAIASDVPPAMGVVTAIIGGFVASLLGGSEFQISGPTGAMVVVVLGVVAAHGIQGLILATLIAGVILLAVAALKLGKIIEYIPSPVIVGFTAGIAVIIFFGQINNFFGISPIYPAGAEFIHKTWLSLASIAQANIGALLLAALTVAILIITPRINRRVPGSIVAVVITTALALLIPSFFAVKTVGDIGTIPSSLPWPALPPMTWAIVLAVLPAALTIAALAAIESLLSAVVADGMTDTKHQPNRELFGQGIANISSALFGGMPVTGAIARTATNIRNGGKSRMSGIFHAVFLLLFALVLAAYAVLIPLATLAGILMFVAFNMVEWERIRLIFRTPLSDVAVMLTTFLVTVLVDLTAAIEVGLILAALLFMKRMSDLYKVEELEGKKDDNELARTFKHKDISIYTINGPLFFGAASRFDQQVASTPGGHKPIKIIRMKYVPFIDATGINFLEATYKKHKKMGGVVILSTVQPGVLKVIKESGLAQEIYAEDHICTTTRGAVIHALQHAHRLHGEPEEVTPEELSQYNLTKLDLEEAVRDAPTTDIDPVAEMLDSVGVTRARKVAKKVTRHVAREGLRTVRSVAKAGEEHVKSMQNVVQHATQQTPDAGKQKKKKKNQANSKQRKK
jgi:SulP family sulfate permease